MKNGEINKINVLIDDFCNELKRKCSTDEFCDKSVENILYDLMGIFDYKTQRGEKSFIRSSNEINEGDDEIRIPPGC